MYLLTSLSISRLHPDTQTDMSTTASDVGDGQWPVSDLEATQIIPEEYYENRQGDLAGTAIVSGPTRLLQNLLMFVQPLARRYYSEKQATARRARDPSC